MLVNRKSLNVSTSVYRGLLDSNGEPIPIETVDLRKLPQIDREALPGLPEDMQAHLQGGDPPVIIVWHPPSNLHVEMPLLERGNVEHYAQAIRAAVLKQAMGEAPEGDGYRVRHVG
jgi:hypothetical protein